jgi:hypothetical protein
MSVDVIWRKNKEIWKNETVFKENEERRQIREKVNFHN